MGSWIDHLGMIVLDAGVSAIALVAIFALAVVVCWEPTRRLRLVRWAFIALLALIPLELTDQLPRFDLWTLPQRTGLTNLVTSLAIDLGGAARDDQGPARWWLRGFVLAYVLGVSAALGWLGLGYLGLFRIAARSLPPSEEARALYESLGTRAGVIRPGLRVATKLRGPVLVGFFRPTILIPSDYDPPNPSPASLERLRLSLLHELAHHEGRDPLFLLAGRLAQSFWFFLPPLGWVLDRMRLDQEFLADRRAALGFGATGAYAASLLDLSHDDPTAEVAHHLAMLATVEAVPSLERAPGSPLFQRLWMLVRSPGPVEQRPPSWWSWGLPGVTIALTLGTSSLALMPASAARPPLDDQPILGERAFFLSSLEIAARRAQANGRAPRVELPIRLPSEFDLVVEVHSTTGELAQTRIAGRVVGIPWTVLSPRDDATPSWHRVRLRRGSLRDALWIDGQPVPTPSDCDPFPVWLTLEPPPDHDARYRDLEMRW